MLEALQWAASLSCIAAAIMVSADLGRKITGWGFAVFTVSSLLWIAAGVIEGEGALTLQNAVLTGVNLIGVYRWLIRDIVKARREKWSAGAVRCQPVHAHHSVSKDQDLLILGP